MAIRRSVIILIFGMFNVLPLLASEGLWIPSLIGEQNIVEMQEMGLMLDAEDIYDINHKGITDAVVSLGGFCTASVISDEGLIITNHHCGLRTIQRHSTLAANYLTDGYWAMDRSEELPNPGLYVRFLRQIVDVSDEILKGVEPEMPESGRTSLVRLNTLIVEENVGDTSGLIADVKSFHYGNQYYLFLYEQFDDVRLVAAPPSSIGKFGWDRDNWVWPRHTGDFSLLRIYAGSDNEPAEYDPENLPYRPARYLEISLEGVEEGDFTMVAGYPGTTTQYLTSDELQWLTEESLPRRIDARTARLEIMEEYMAESEVAALKYAAKSGISNYQKKWKGQVHAKGKSSLLIEKRSAEESFESWAEIEGSGKYIGLTDSINALVGDMKAIAMLRDYEREVIRGIEIIRFASEFNTLQLAWAANNNIWFESELASLKDEAMEFHRDYIPDIDREIAVRLMEMYFRDIPTEGHPEMVSEDLARFGGRFDLYVTWLFSNSYLANDEKILAGLDSYNSQTWEQINNDPFYRLSLAFDGIFAASDSLWSVMTEKKSALYRQYVEGLMLWDEEKVPYPDANRTMRISYGKVEGYRPRDATLYGHLSLMEGIFQKYNTGLWEYAVPDSLLALINDTIPVCFLANNHTTNGSSGSPVLDEKGRLIGVSFDRNWEGTISDFMYSEKLCRNISVDVRYVLFIIDKFAGAGYLLDEMDITP